MANYMNKVEDVKNLIKSESALYYYRATPFSEHGEFNYNGALTEGFFFENMFSDKGKSGEYIRKIKTSLKNHTHKSIVLIGNQGCGKTTFVHNLKRNCEEYRFIILDFDADTSNPTLAEYIEKMSTYLLERMKENSHVNIALFNLYITNKTLITQKINANNNIINFFDEFESIFIKQGKEAEADDFIKTINGLFFNQILSLIVLWHLCEAGINIEESRTVCHMIFCLDNLDVLVNKEIIDLFFKEYFRFVRNVDAIIQHMDAKFVRNSNMSYNRLFTFIFSCRQHTWARVKEHYQQENSFVRISSLVLNITDAFNKRDILTRRRDYIRDNVNFYGEFFDNIEKINYVLADMDSTEKYQHNIYDLFDDDYRQCNITFEEISNDYPYLFDEYIQIKRKVLSGDKTSGKSLYGVRGIIYKALFDKFKSCGIFDRIGVLELNAERPLVSNARMILNYLDAYTYDSSENNQKYVSYESLVSDFQDIIEEREIDNALNAMFKLGANSPWNELVAFDEIHSEKIETCKNLDIFITKAGHEYLSLIATHFEFFNTRITQRRTIDIPLFSEKSKQHSKNSKYIYNFQETISLVLASVRKCCERMSRYYETVMYKKYRDHEDYLQSPYVYSDAGVLHGERIIHTHIRYIDTYRLYILREVCNMEEKIDINRILVNYIKDYICVGKDNEKVLTQMSIEKLFPGFEKKIEIIEQSGYTDFDTRIDINETIKK